MLQLEILEKEQAIIPVLRLGHFFSYLPYFLF